VNPASTFFSLHITLAALQQSLGRIQGNLLKGLIPITADLLDGFLPDGNAFASRQAPFFANI